MSNTLFHNNIDSDCIHTPTSLVYVAGVLRAEGFDVSLMDANAENNTWGFIEARLRELKPDWVIYRATPSTFYEDIKVSKICKKLGIKTLLLCWNLHSEKERVLKECPELDVYLNEYHYEHLIPSILDGKPIPQGKKTTDIPLPSWDLVPDFKKFYTRTSLFSPWAVIRGSKGCPFDCNFCIDAGTGFSPRSPELIGDELEYLVNKRKVRYVSFFDDSFEVDEDWCYRIGDEIVRRQLSFKWYINSRSDLICKRGAGFFKDLHSIGLDGSSIGIEFGSDEMLQASNKHTTVSMGKEAITVLKAAHVKSYISCMMGYLDETRDQMLRTFDFIRENKPTGFQINTVVPYKGTRLYEDAEAQGLIEGNLDWRGISCVPLKSVPVKLSKMDNEEIFLFRQSLYRRLYFGKWLFYNLLSLRSFDDLRLGIGYFMSSLDRLRKGVEYSH